MNGTIQTTLITTLILVAGAGLLPAQPPSPSGPVGAAVLAAADGNGAEADKAARPSILIPEPLHTFDPVVDGTEVVHDFQVYNRGTGILAIEKVQTG